MSKISVDVWLYGNLACYGNDAEQRSFANLHMRIPEKNTMADLLARLGMNTEERGITFINGRLSGCFSSLWILPTSTALTIRLKNFGRKS